MAFLSDSARVLWPKAGESVRRQTMIGLAKSLVAESPLARRGASAGDLDLAAATLQGTLAELSRMIQVGVVDGPALHWQSSLVTVVPAVFDMSLPMGGVAFANCFPANVCALRPQRSLTRTPECD
jgi:hypothetical protein